jgi:hypothetical protein
MKFFKKCLILLGWLGFLGCSVVAISYWQKKPVQEISNSQITDDINQLVTSMDHAYAGKTLLPEEYNKAVESLKQIATNHPDGIRVKDFTEEINTALKIIPDGHLTAYSAIYIPFETSSCAGDSDTKHIEQITHEGKKVLHLKFDTFMIDNSASVDAVISDLKELLPKSDALVVDLRKNGGGSVDVPLQIAALLWGESFREHAFIPYTPNPYKSSLILHNKVVYALQANLFLNSDSSFGKMLARRGATPQNLSRAPASDETDYAASTSEDLNLYNDDEPKIEERGFARPIYVLVDKYCASACERFLEVMEYHPYVKSVGQQTAGAVQFGGIGLLTLEKSRINVTLASSYMTYLDKRQVERHGYAPMIKVEDKTDSLQIALSEILKSERK